MLKDEESGRYLGRAREGGGVDYSSGRECAGDKDIPWD